MTDNIYNRLTPVNVQVIARSLFVVVAACELSHLLNTSDQVQLAFVTAELFAITFWCVSQRFFFNN